MLNSFTTYSAIVDGFVIVNFFFETLHSTILLLTTKLSLRYWLTS